MSDDDLGPDVEPDGFVRTALQLLPIPAHDDDFWVRLDAALDAEGALPEPRGTLVAAPPPSDADGAERRSPSSIRRSRWCRPPSDARPTPCSRWSPPRPSWWWPSPAPPCWTTSAAPRSARLTRRPTPPSRPSCRTPSPRGTVTTLPAAREDESSEAVLQWVDDLGEGDSEAAWAAMGEESQAHVGSEAEFEGLMTDLAEGYGAWSAASPTRSS